MSEQENSVPTEAAGEEDEYMARCRAAGFAEGVPGAVLRERELEIEEQQKLRDDLNEQREQAAKAEAERAERLNDEGPSDEDRKEALEGHQGLYAHEGERMQAMVDEGASDAEIQDAAHSGALVASETDEEGNPAPAEDSDAAKQDEAHGANDESASADAEDEADEQRLEIDSQAPDDDKREAAHDAKQERKEEENDSRNVEELKEEAKAKGVKGYSSMKRAELLAALARD